MGNKQTSEQKRQRMENKMLLAYNKRQIELTKKAARKFRKVVGKRMNRLA